MKYFQTYLIAISFLALIWSCGKEDNFIVDKDAKLEFSLDTLRFDTIFTELGSATRILKVYNRHDRPIRISKIFVEGKSQTSFRLNIDGFSSNEAEEVEIAANDSLYIFGEVTVDPDAPVSVSPFVIEDFIVFETNGNTQKVLLEAWGQNANYIPSRFGKGQLSLLTCDFGEVTWDDPKPYVIYGFLIIDSCALNIPAGARVYVHGGIAQNETFGVFNDGYIYVLQNGKLLVNGTAENPVIIQGDRLEEDFQEDAGQWSGIILGKGSKGNQLDFATVKNARFSVYVDSSATLQANNCRFYNTVSSGLVGFHSTIDADNCLVYNNGGNSVQLLNGGDYSFDYCTLASYGVDASSIGMSNFFCYDSPFECQVRSEYRLNVSIRNSILFGSRKDEIELSDFYGRMDAAMFNIKFENCIVRVDDLLTDREALYADFFETYCTPCINATTQDALFFYPNGDDYHLDTLSIAEQMAIPLSEITNDLENNLRDAEKPDIGSYEYQY
ncbi:MAG: hypothetical protein GY705_16470 [Bacteroidetes bacterium]|nr:hypothetical protein [Bacteroidota bacterium]